MTSTIETPSETKTTEERPEFLFESTDLNEAAAILCDRRLRLFDHRVDTEKNLIVFCIAGEALVIERRRQLFWNRHLAVEASVHDDTRHHLAKVIRAARDEKRLRT